MTSATPDKTQDCAVVIGVGASQGIGAAVCRLFAKEGLKVYVAGRTFQKIEAVAAQIHANAGEAVAFRLDAEDIHQVQALFDTITSQNERITAVIHNVGNIPSIFYAAHCRFYSNVAIHFLSAYLVSQSCLKSLKIKITVRLFLLERVRLYAANLFRSFYDGKICLKSLCLKSSPNL